MRRDRRLCQYRYPGICTTHATQVDHVLPGDDHSLTNLKAICTECHKHKSSREGHESKRKRNAMRKRETKRHPGLM